MRNRGALAYGIIGAAVAGTLTLSTLVGVAPAAAKLPIVRFATFNASLNRGTEGQLLTDLSGTANAQAAKVAEVVQRVRPDVLLLNEFDYVSGNRATRLFQTNYLSRAHNGARPISYPYAYTAPVNTGVPSGMDLNKDGKIGGGDDAYGFGLFPGQYGMVVYSKYPIDAAHARTFQNFRWKDMPGAKLPTDPATGQGWYSAAVLEKFRLSSKSHWDLPIQVGRTKVVHFLVSHPTPPSFDGPEDRNGTRNHDEIRFWADYVQAGAGDPRVARYLYDDRGVRGGLRPGSSFVIAGDQNADPTDGDSVRQAQLLTHARRVIDPRPRSVGGPEASKAQGGANQSQRGNPALDTGDFSDKSPGNLRVDYVLPSAPLVPLRSGVFWPAGTDSLSRLNDASDHHSVWVDVLTAGAGSR